MFSFDDIIMQLTSKWIRAGSECGGHQVRGVLTGHDKHSRDNLTER